MKNKIIPSKKLLLITLFLNCCVALFSQNKEPMAEKNLASIYTLKASSNIFLNNLNESFKKYEFASIDIYDTENSLLTNFSCVGQIKTNYIFEVYQKIHINNIIKSTFYKVSDLYRLPRKNPTKENHN